MGYGLLQLLPVGADHLVEPLAWVDEFVAAVFYVDFHLPVDWSAFETILVDQSSYGFYLFEGYFFNFESRDVKIRIEILSAP